MSSAKEKMIEQAMWAIKKGLEKWKIEILLRKNGFNVEDLQLVDIELVQVDTSGDSIVYESFDVLRHVFRCGNETLEIDVFEEDFTWRVYPAGEYSIYYDDETLNFDEFQESSKGIVLAEFLNKMGYEYIFRKNIYDFYNFRNELARKKIDSLKEKCLEHLPGVTDIKMASVYDLNSVQLVMSNGLELKISTYQLEKSVDAHKKKEVIL